MADMAHVSGLVAVGLHPSPFDYCDVVTTTTHKTLRGPRAALIFYRRLPVAPLNSNGNGVDVSVKTSNIQYKDLGRNICEAVFPGLQGGPHVNSIAAIAVALKEASQPAFYDYQKSVLSNMRVLCNRLQSFGYTLESMHNSGRNSLNSCSLIIVTGGSDTHMCLVDLRPIKIEASCAEALFEMIGIAINKNTVPGDVNAVKPGGIRLGSAALTSRGFKEADFEEVASIIHTGIQLTKEIHNLAGSSLASFKKLLQKNKEMNQRVLKLKKEVESFAASFPMPGFDDF
ncbi:unnamed protein product [Protopolystoma xenopodis]|uniref:Serine hydroxymethyltransferase-like domain-containing protein n=1 Tax=Protopolystoma xenopodis TaxID=117903 RepID=A0A3S5B0W2_9PLAT|nr:unnamed protein product [Protopolystoma xenopodis]